MASPKKKGLGKGLSALISAPPDFEARPVGIDDASETVFSDGSRLIEIDPRDIRPNPKQPRRNFDDETLAELAESIRNEGVHQPVIVRKMNGKYELVSGERRVRASVLARLDVIPAIVREISDDDMLKLGLVENIHREDLNPIETARAYRSLIEEFDWTQDELATQVGKKRATITNSLRLLNLPEDVQECVIQGDVSMGHARALLGLESPRKQSELCGRIRRDGLSVRETERLVSTPKKAPTPSARPRKDPHVAELEDQLRRQLATKVSISLDGQNRGKIEIGFYDLDDLQRILDLLRS